ncbi:MAG: dephospho-CoA kinase [Nitrospirae bacterium]|nr:MAG: dephospho-CoA kinase [Nitrospirota bacterium]
MITVGLTGNYGMGKSTVSGMFRDLGASVIDTDKVVSELFEDEEVRKELKNCFGDDVIEDGKVNKELLSEVVFTDPSTRISLENILHPRVFQRTEQMTKQIAASAPEAVVIIEATVIFERGYQNRFDRIVTVYTDEDTAIERLAAKGVSEGQARKRLASQFPIQKKMDGSDFTIDNGNSPEDTKKQTEHIYQKLLGYANN